MIQLTSAFPGFVPRASAHSLGELDLLDEAPACALCSATVVARTRNTEDVTDHHVVIPRNVLPQLTQKVVLLDTTWPYERADVVPARTVQRHHRPIPTEPDDMAVLAQGDEIGQLHRALADVQRFIHVERVHDHTGFLPLPGSSHSPVTDLPLLPSAKDHRVDPSSFQAYFPHFRTQPVPCSE